MWAVNTSAGIIIIDTIFDYSVEDEVVEGLKKVGLDPANIPKYVIRELKAAASGSFRRREVAAGSLSRARAAVGCRLGSAGSERWHEADARHGGDRRAEADARRHDAADVHHAGAATPGTISTIIPVTDNGKPHTVAEWGGTAFNFTITPDKDRNYWFHTYINSAERFRQIAAAAGADVGIANHTIFDGSKQKLPALANRKPGDPNPWVIGEDSVRRYMTVAVECAHAGLTTLEGR